MPTYDVSGPIDVDVHLSVGYVELIASDRDDVSVEVSPSKPGRSGDVSLARDVVVSLDSGRLRITAPRRLKLFGPSGSVDVRCELPTGSRIAVETAYGSVGVRGRFGDCRITAKYGNVNADTVDGLLLEAPFGTVDITEVTGRLDATVGHGLVRIGRVGGDTRLRGSHGTIELDTAGGDVEAATSGPLTIGRALGNVAARSAHGPIRVREVSGGTIRLENGHANVEVGVPAGVAAWIDAASTHGRVRNDLTPDPDAANTGRHVELRLRANHADVVIRRAPDAPRRETTP
ncbi:hypothetical protein GA0074692_5350 [Micromonospora pallida]|uniref:Adhesin n=1 Tax=Micromonospora pallida TaxID=145854 RepID=A0A1C6TCX5_9ACTN|nr:hypothetical protein [Micromonospora pallida]SCL39402.1 hypothetical protein GA0074692_5350 [Micromonospora pallida]